MSSEIDPSEFTSTPVVSRGINDDGVQIPDPTEFPDITDAVHHWSPVRSPSGMVLYTGPFNTRIREVEQGPDGAIYLLTNAADDGMGAVWRMDRLETRPASADDRRSGPGAQAGGTD